MVLKEVWNSPECFADGRLENVMQLMRLDVRWLELRWARKRLYKYENLHSFRQLNVGEVLDHQPFTMPHFQATKPPYWLIEDVLCWKYYRYLDTAVAMYMLRRTWGFSRDHQWVHGLVGHLSTLEISKIHLLVFHFLRNHYVKKYSQVYFCDILSVHTPTSRPASQHVVWMNAWMLFYFYDKNSLSTLMQFCCNRQFCNSFPLNSSKALFNPRTPKYSNQLSNVHNSRFNSTLKYKQPARQTNNTPS